MTNPKAFLSSEEEGVDHLHCWHMVNRNDDMVTFECCVKRCTHGPLVLNDLLSEHQKWNA